METFRATGGTKSSFLMGVKRVVWIIAAVAVILIYDSGVVQQAPIDWTGISQGVTQTVTDALNKFAEAIQNFEGQPGDLNYRNNNPGNLMYAGQPGAIGQDSKGLAIFDTWSDGLAALKRQIALDASRYPNWSIYDYIANKYAPAGPNNPNDVAYANSIASALGVTADAKLGTLELT